MNEHQKLAIKALESVRENEYHLRELHRLRDWFKNLTPEQKDQEYGKSGMTRQEILDLYEALDAQISAAIEWVKEQE